MSRVLVVAAHPDDELLGAGATLAKHVASGDEVHALVLSEGARSRYADDMVDVLAASANEAAKVLGLSSVTLGGLPDQRLDTLPLLELTAVIEQVVDQVDPTHVYLHCVADVNADHAMAARATWTACRPYVVPRLERLAVFETPSSTEWGLPSDPHAFAPNSFVDVTQTLAAKLAAMSCYASELRAYPHPRSLQALTERAGYWGSRVGVAAAEPFQIMREARR